MSVSSRIRLIDTSPQTHKTSHTRSISVGRIVVARTGWISMHELVDATCLQLGVQTLFLLPCRSWTARFELALSLLSLRYIQILDTIDTDSVELERIGIGQCCWRSLHANNRVSTLPTRVHPRASCGSFFLRPSHRVTPSILRLDFLNILKLCVSQSISPSHIQIDL